MRAQPESFRAIGPGARRARPPQETLDLAMARAADFGITRVADMTGLDRTGIPVVMVCRPNARSSAVFHGKGVDLVSAKTSGVMEAIETWHAENVVSPLRFESFNDLRRGQPEVSVEGLPRLPGARFDPDAPLLWVCGRNLADGAPAWTPFELVNAHSTLDGPPTSGCFNASTNGLASGNHLLEATSHALCELIERDATALWRQNPPAHRRRLALDSVADEACRETLARFARADIEIGAFDVTSDVSVPAFQVFALDRTGEIGHIGVGAGCHPHRDIALLRALTEAAQVRTTYITGSREDISRADYDPSRMAARNDAMRALLRHSAADQDLGELPRHAFATFEEEVGWLVERLTQRGVGPLVSVDLSRPEYDFSVVRVIAPGLEGFDHNPASYAPGPRALRLRARA